MDLNALVPQSEIEGLKIAAQDAAAVEFYGIVMNNFGPGNGEDRPAEWPDLSPRYALRVHDGDTTPKLIVTEDLMASIDQRLGEVQSASVFTDSEYADIHQWGGNWGKNPVPSRPFFPIVGNEENAQLTEYSEQKCIAAMQKAVDSRI